MTPATRQLFARVLLAATLASAAASATAADSRSGEQLFHSYCGACHGNDGGGGVGVPLSLPAFINAVDDNYLRTTIRLGRPGRIMPAFDHLPAGHIDKLIEHMRSWTGVRPPAFSTSPVSGDFAHGKTLYQQHCAACHGENGEGGHGTGVTFSRPRDLPILAPALNNTGFLSAASDAMIKTTLTNGRVGTPMVSFRAAGLSDSDIDDVVSYVRGFERQGIQAVSENLEEPSYLVVESPYNVSKTIENVKQAVVAANMRLIRVQNLDEGFVAKNRENKKRVMVYSCGFNFLNQALKIDPRVGLFLPCRVTVVAHQGKVSVMTLNPKRLAYLFNNSELTELCSTMKQKYLQLMEEATF